MNARVLLAWTLALAIALAFPNGPAVATTGAPRPATLAPDAPYLAPPGPFVHVPQGCADIFDPGNQTCNSPDPPLLVPEIYAGLVSEPFFPSFDEDFYRVLVGAGQRLSVTITFEHSVGDLNMAIYSPDCNFLVNSATANNAEHVEYTNPGPAAEYRIVVDNNGPSCVTYTMSITLDCMDGYEPNNACGTTTAVVGPGTVPSLWLNDFNGTLDVDWYRVTLRRSETLTARARFALAPANAEMGLLSEDCATLLAHEFTSGALVHEVSFVNDGPDRVVKVGLVHYDAAICHKYDLEIEVGGTGNLDNTSVYPGWSDAVVPRNSTTPDPPTLTPTLDGNTPNTTVYWTIWQTGPYLMPQWDTEIAFDGAGAGLLYPPDPAPFPAQYWGVHGPFDVRGGRHTVQSRTDQFGLIHETNESDNTYTVQHVWSPLVTAFETPNVRPGAPDRGFLFYPNSDGFEYSRPGSVAWVVSIAARQPADDYDLYVYDDYSGSNAGFSNFIGGSGAFGNTTDFTVGHFSGTPVTVRPAAVTYFAGSGGQPFAADQSDARLRNGPILDGPASYPGQTLPADRLADVYEAYMNAGSTFYLTLHRTSGSSDLQFYVYPGTSGGIYGRFTGSPSSPLSPLTDVMTYTATESGWHPIVVCRDNGTDADLSLTYDFHWSKAGFVDAGADPTAAADLAFLGVWPNPIAGNGRLEFSLPRPGRASVALYDASGRLVRRIADRAFDAGRQSITYDGHGDDGGRLSPGVYWVTLRFEDRSLTRRVVQL